MKLLYKVDGNVCVNVNHPESLNVLQDLKFYAPKSIKVRNEILSILIDTGLLHKLPRMRFFMRLALVPTILAFEQFKTKSTTDTEVEKAFWKILTFASKSDANVSFIADHFEEARTRKSVSELLTYINAVTPKGTRPISDADEQTFLTLDTTDKVYEHNVMQTLIKLKYVHAEHSLAFLYTCFFQNFIQHLKAISDGKCSYIHISLR